MHERRDLVFCSWFHRYLCQLSTSTSTKYIRWVVLRGFLHVWWVLTLANSSIPFLRSSKEGTGQNFLEKIRIGEGSEEVEFEPALFLPRAARGVRVESQAW
jgi:hypothetical protein